MGRIHQNAGVIGVNRSIYDPSNKTGVYDYQANYDAFSGAPTNREGFNQGLGYSTALYPFTTFTFTTAGATGRQAATLSTFQSSYSAESWTQDTNFFNVATAGFQRWVVPAIGNYSFVVAGAQGGGGGGYGAVVSFDMDLVERDELLISVGHRGINTNGTYRPSSGGGASGVYSNTESNDTNSSNNFIIAIAGGGGGRSTGSSNGLTSGMHGQSGTSGANGQSTSAWRNTTGGTNGAGSVNGGGTGGGGPGAGYLSNGADSSGSAGYSKNLNNWLGGNQRTSGQETCTGAFGGAGGASVNSGNYRGGGGGGGYSGGGAGVGSGSGSAGKGGGGGSFVASNGNLTFNMISNDTFGSYTRALSNRALTGGTTSGTNGNSLSAGNYSDAADGYVTITYNG